MIKNAEPITSAEFNKGLVTRSDFLKGDTNASPNCMNVRFMFDGSLRKRLGASSVNSVAITSGGQAGWVIDSNGTLSTSLQAYWKLDEASGTRTDTFDGLSLSQTGNLASIVGIRNQAALFESANSTGLFRATTSQIETGNVNFSVAGWIYLNSTSTTVQRTVAGKRDPEVDAATELLLHCDGSNGSTTFTDSSPTPKMVTANGNAHIDTGQSKFGGASAAFDGTGDYLTSDDNDAWDLGTGDFTWDFWFRSNTADPVAVLFDREDGSVWSLQFNAANNMILQLAAGPPKKTEAHGGILADTWYHIAVVRSGTNLMFFKDGVQLGSPTSNNSNLVGTGLIAIGASVNGANGVNGYIDEFRFTKGVARWTANFTPPTSAYAVTNYEYWLFVNTNNNLSWRVSSSGSNNTASIEATSFGALTTATWYNFVAWHSNNAHVGISVNLSANSSAYTTGVRVGSAPFTLGVLSDGLPGPAVSYLDARMDEVGFWKKILTAQERSDLYSGGSGNTYTSSFSNAAWYGFDFGASNIRWITICAGTGIVASSNFAKTFVNVATTRTASFQYLDRSKNVVIATSDSYDPTLYWAGSAGTFAIALAPGSAPATKFSVNYNGFLILLNSSSRKRGFFYADENTQLTDTWTNSFDLPSSADDEITAVFILYKFLYVSTRYKIFRVAFVGGNPDWSYLKVRDWGYVPRTVSIVSLKGGGQVAVGLDWDRRLRMFDGFDDLFLSDAIENDNGICDFSMNKISYAGSGLLVSNGALNPITQEYRLNLAIGANSIATTNAILLNMRNLAFYPYSNQNWQTVFVAESNNQRQMFGVGSSGFVYILDSGNLDGSTPIDDYYDSPPLFSKVPEAVSKGKNLNLFFASQSCGTVYSRDRVDLSNVWSSYFPLRDGKGTSEFLGTESSIKIQRILNVPAVYNTYQFQLTSSSGTANPWSCDRFDYFQQGFGLGRGN